MSVRDVVQAAAGVGGANLYVEDVFSTYLYTGNGTSQTITNGIDLAGEGGMVWAKTRSVLASSHVYDTERGATKWLITNSTSAESTLSTGLTAFNSDGFSVGSSTGINGSGHTHASWTFRKAPKFFDVVTYTGTGVTGLSIPHNLGSVPGMIIIKHTDAPDSWFVYHRSLPTAYRLYLEDTSAQMGPTYNAYLSSVTDTQFTISSTYSTFNSSGGNYVAYLFAHNAGGFGDDGLQDIISCGSYTGTGALLDVTLGWEPQWVLVKDSTNAYNWCIFDNMRGVVSNGQDARLHPNLSNAEATDGDYIDFTSTGFRINGNISNTNNSGHGYIYIAIRRPMKTPESGSEVFAAQTWSGNSTGVRTFSTSFNVDFTFPNFRNLGATHMLFDRLRGSGTTSLDTSSSQIEGYNSGAAYFDQQNGIRLNSTFNSSTINYSNWMFRRAPGFFDVVCFTGISSGAVNHNLTSTPELIIAKARNVGRDWQVYHKDLGATKNLVLSSTAAAVTNSNFWYGTLPTDSVFYVGSEMRAGDSNVAYLFASCPGVSKVGSYTGNGSSQTINCGFSAGARFVLIKRTDSTGDWYVWDSARGIVSGNDPHLSLNTTAAEVTTDDSVDPDSTGFIVNQVAATNINVSSASYIFLAVS